MPKKTPATDAGELFRRGKQIVEASKSGKEILPAPIPPPRELAPIQQFIADEVADLLINGGHENDTGNLIFATMLHMQRRIFREFKDSEKEVNERAIEAVQKSWQDIAASLRMEWNRNKNHTLVGEELEPKDATARIRARVIHTLRSRFEDFIREGTPEEHYLLSSIFMDHNNVGDRLNLDHLPLAQAFDYHLTGKGDWFIRVPYSMRKQVETYIECLKAANVRDGGPEVKTNAN